MAASHRVYSLRSYGQAGDETFEGTATFDAASNKIVALLNGVKYTANVVIRKDDITVFPHGTIGDGTWASCRGRGCACRHNIHV